MRIDRSLLVGWSKLVSGNVAAGVLRLIGFVIAAQALDIAALGVIVLIEAYVRFVDGVFNFQSVNVLTRFLAEAKHQKDSLRFSGFVKAGFVIDGVTACVACAIAVASLPLVGPHVGVSGEWIGLAMAYALVILTRILGVTEAVLRCFDKFWAIGLRGTISAFLVVAGSLVAWSMNAGAAAFLAVWMIAEVIANVIFAAWTVAVLRRNGAADIWRADARKEIRAAPGFWSMLWQTNATFGVRLFSQEGDVLIAGALLGPAAAALLRAAKNLASMLGQLGRPLQQVASAPIAILWAEKNYRRILSYSGELSLYAVLGGGVITLFFVVFAKPTLSILFGADFVAASAVLVLLLFARSIYLSGVALLPTMITLEISDRFLLSVIIATAMFYIAIATLIGPLGLVGIGVAHVVFDAVWAATGWFWSFRKVLRLEQARSGVAA